MSGRRRRLTFDAVVLDNRGAFYVEWPRLREREEYPNEYVWRLSIFADRRRTILLANFDNILTYHNYYKHIRAAMNDGQRYFFTLAAREVFSDGTVSEEPFVCWERDNGANRQQMSIMDLGMLEENAIDHFGGEMVQITHLQRSYFRGEWHRIMRQGRGWMRGKFRTDKQGHYSPFNNTFRGTFFFATNAPMPFSKFGDTIKMFRLDVIFRQFDDLVFYFADVKCYNGSFHYVTIAICRQESAQHRYFSSKLGLAELDMEDNPFLQLHFTRNGQPTFYAATRNCWIEIFLMEDIHIGRREWRNVDKVETYPIDFCGGNSQRICRNCSKCGLGIG